MFQLVSNVANNALLQPAGDNPVAIAALDIRNAFNSLYRSSLASTLQDGCPEDYSKASATLSQPDWLGYDILWNHFRSHYGAKGKLKFYHNGEIFEVDSSSGVQQGDPLGSVLFALGLHPIITKLASSIPEVLITAYADNVVISGPLSFVK